MSDASSNARRARRRDFTAEAFISWMVKHEMTNVDAAKVLGCNIHTIRNWRALGAPYYIGLACAAIDHDLEIPYVLDQGTDQVAAE